MSKMKTGMSILGVRVEEKNNKKHLTDYNLTDVEKNSGKKGKKFLSTDHNENSSVNFIYDKELFKDKKHDEFIEKYNSS